MQPILNLFLKELRMLTNPQRIQRKRSKGWRMPDNTVYVGRPTLWGNPFVPGKPFCRKKMQGGGGEETGFVEDATHAVRLYRRFMPLEVRVAARIHLVGKNLACWCRAGEPCHANVLLKIANTQRRKRKCTTSI